MTCGYGTSWPRATFQSRYHCSCVIFEAAASAWTQARMRSELVVPIVHDGQLIGVLDLDSPIPARFDAEDARGGEAIAALLAARIA